MTPAIRALESAEVAFTLHEYEPDLEAEAFGLDAAAKLGIEPERVFKTLVTQTDRKELVMTVIPVAERLDPKKLAGAVGTKKADLADPALAERATGYVIGGISPLGGRKRLRTLIHESALGFATIVVNGGKRGLMIELSPQDLMRLTGATTASLVVTH